MGLLSVFAQGGYLTLVQRSSSEMKKSTLDTPLQAQNFFKASKDIPAKNTPSQTSQLNGFYKVRIQNGSTG